MVFPPLGICNPLPSDYGSEEERMEETHILTKLIDLEVTHITILHITFEGIRHLPPLRSQESTQ